MKRMIDAILDQHFHLSADAGSYLLGSSGSLVAQHVPAAGRGQPMPGSPIPPGGTLPPFPPPGRYPVPPAPGPRRGGKSRIATGLLLFFVIILITSILFIGPRLFSQDLQAMVGQQFRRVHHQRLLQPGSQSV